jgi:hypothetical protein
VIVVELSRYLFLAGALPLIFLGVVHALLTPLTPDQPKPLSPRDADYRRSMSEQKPLLTRRTNLWLLWVGFNLSHSVGVLLFGIVVLLAGRSTAAFQVNGPFLPFAVVVSATYVAIGLRFWYRAPVIGIAISGICFIASSVFRILAG